MSEVKRYYATTVIEHCAGAFVSSKEYDALAQQLAASEAQIRGLQGACVDLSSLNRELEHKMDYFKGFAAQLAARDKRLEEAAGLLREQADHMGKVVNELLQCSQGDGLVAANYRTSISYAALNASHRVNAFLTTIEQGKENG